MLKQNKHCKMEKKIINQVKIDQSNMRSSSSSRTLFIKGETGAEFIVNVIKINSTSKESYYNFKTKSFTTAFISENNLSVKMSGVSFQRNILFPTDATGDVYKIVVLAKQQTTQFSNGHFVVTKKITQVGQTTVYLELDEGTEVDSSLTAKYTANPPDTTISSVGSTVNSSPVNIPISWTLTNTSSDADGFGFMLPNRPASNQFAIPDTYWFTQQVQVCDGTISSSTTVVLDSVTNLVVGMSLVALSSGSISGSPIITSIDGNTVTLSVAQSVNDGVSLYFRAYGSTLISQVFGLSINFSNIVAKGTQLTKTVRSNTTFPASDGAVTLNLNGTYGIAGASLVRISGYNINENANNNLITSVSASSSAGSVNVTFAGSADDVVSSIVPIGTTVYINGSHQEIKIEGTVTINKYPASNAKLALDLTKFITHGAATA